MKKIIYLVLLFGLLYTITACGSSREGRNHDGEQQAGVSDPALSDTWTEGSEESEKEAVRDSETQENIRQTESIQETGMSESVQDTGQEVKKMKIQVGDTVFTAILAENSSVDALKELMADGPLTLNMSDYANMEKGADLGVTLPQNNEQMNAQAGDIILYQGRTFVIYYDTNSWSLTPIGKIDSVDAEELKEALGTGDVTVKLSLE